MNCDRCGKDLIKGRLDGGIVYRHSEEDDMNCPPKRIPRVLTDGPSEGIATRPYNYDNEPTFASRYLNDVYPRPVEPAAPVVQIPEVLRDKSGDWNEDFTHENGNYLSHCCECKRIFMGHKRRIACKSCVTEKASQPTPVVVPDETAICKHRIRMPHECRDCSQEAAAKLVIPSLDEYQAGRKKMHELVEQVQRPRVKKETYRNLNSAYDIEYYYKSDADAYMNHLEQQIAKLTAQPAPLPSDQKDTK